MCMFMCLFEWTPNLWIVSGKSEEDIRSSEASWISSCEMLHKGAGTKLSSSGMTAIVLNLWAILQLSLELLMIVNFIRMYY